MIVRSFEEIKEAFLAEAENSNEIDLKSEVNTGEVYQSHGDMTIQESRESLSKLNNSKKINQASDEKVCIEAEKIEAKEIELPESRVEEIK